jgi:hypothetical protein
MAKSTTFKGVPKPMGASGHFYEPRRHALQAKGIKTGNVASMTGLYDATPKMRVKSIETPVTEVKDMDFMGEEPEPPKKSFFEQVGSGFKQEQEAKRKKYTEFASRELNRPVGTDPDSTEVHVEESEDDGLPKKFGHILADLTNDYDSHDLAALSNAELETLAVKLKSQTKDSMFGEAYNPFVEELKNRYQAEAEMQIEKAKMNAELEPLRQKAYAEVHKIHKEHTDEDSGLFGDLGKDLKNIIKG